VSNGKVCIVTRAILEGATVRRAHFDAPRHNEDSGFTFFDEQDPRPWEMGVGDLQVICMHCLIEDHPEAGLGADIAKRAGDATWFPDGWQVSA
jgi:hypothetical protein